jgi:hypothetical protein
MKEFAIIIADSRDIMCEYIATLIQEAVGPHYLLKVFVVHEAPEIIEIVEHSEIDLAVLSLNKISLEGYGSIFEGQTELAVPLIWDVTTPILWNVPRMPVQSSTLHCHYRPKSLRLR